jgi:regulatory protein
LLERAQVGEEAEELLGKLEEYGAVDDRKLADGVAQYRKESGTMGSGRVLQDLRKRRVPGEMAAEAVAKAYAGTDEGQMIEAWLARKYRGKNLTEWLKEQKNLASAFRRLRTAGFSGGKSIEVLKRISRLPLDEIEIGDEPEG